MRSTTVTRDSSESATSAKHQHVLSWTDLEYSVGITLHRGMCRRAVQSRKMVLSNLTGFVRSGQMCALMGPSGSGKSSLLSVLAGHMPARGRLERGSVQINGESLDKGLRRMAGYVFQDDLLLPALTVRETVEFAAKLRMPQALGHDARQARVESTLEQLGLLGCADVLIGSEKQRGVSGGERKRAAVAVELVARPPLLFLDEPTSGLDAATALLLVRALRGFAERGMLILSSIHQPRGNIFSSFDSLLLLDRGRTAYFGPTNGAVEHMRIHASLELPSQTNPADWIIDIVDAEQLPLDLVPHVAGTPVVLATDGAPSSNLADVWKSSGASAQAAAAAAKAVAEVLAVSTGSEATATSGRQPQFATSLPWQFQVLLSRATRQQRGDVFNTVNVFQIVAVAVIAAMIWSGSTAVQDIIGVLFFVNIQQSFNAQNTVLRLFPSERALMQRERRSDTYHMLPYFLAKSLGDLVAVFVLPILYALIIYFAVGLRIDTAAPFFWYLLLSLTTVFTGQSLGLLVSLAVPDLALANCVSFVFVLFIMLFGGFYVNVDRIPGWISWLRYTSYMYWAFSGMVINEFGGREMPCGSTSNAADYGGCPFNGDRIVEELGYADGTVARSFGFLFAMSMFFRVSAYVCLRFQLSVRI